MTDEEALKARVDELNENLNYYLRNYHRLIGLRYRKSVLNTEFEFLKLKIQRLSPFRQKASFINMYHLKLKSYGSKRRVFQTKRGLC